MEIFIGMFIVGIIAFFIFMKMNKPNQAELIAYRDEIRALLAIQPNDSKKLREYKEKKLKSYEGGLAGMISGEFPVNGTEFNAHKHEPKMDLEEYIDLLEKAKVATIKSLEAQLKARDSTRNLIAKYSNLEERNDDDESSIDMLEKEQERSEISIAEAIQTLSDLGYEYKP